MINGIINKYRMELYQDKDEDELTHLIKDSWDIKTIVEES